MLEHIIAHVFFHYVKERSGSTTPAGPRTLVNREIPNLVRCEDCGFEYVYVMHVKTYRFGQASPESDSAADIYPRTAAREWVPCPNCGWVQREMYSGYRTNRAALFFSAGVLVSLIMLGVLFAEKFKPRFAGYSTKVAFLASTLPALGGLSMAAFWLGLYNPNRSAERRMQRVQQGKRRALPRAQYEAQRAEALRAEREQAQRAAQQTAAQTPWQTVGAPAVPALAVAPIGESLPTPPVAQVPPKPMTEEAKRRTEILDRRRREEEASKQRRAATKAMRDAEMKKRIERGRPDQGSAPARGCRKPPCLFVQLWFGGDFDL